MNDTENNENNPNSELNNNSNNQNENKYLDKIKSDREVGRPTLLTPALTVEITNNIAIGGLSYKDACALSAITQATFYNWMARGRNELERTNGDRTIVLNSELLYVEFFESIQKAIPNRKRALVAKIRSAADQSWQAAAWLLERLHPDEFARRTHVDVNIYRTEVVELIRQGLPYDIIEAELGAEETERLFVEAGEAIPSD